MARPKQATRERIETMLQRAVEGSDRIGLPDVVDEYEQMSVEEYAERKGIEIVENPSPLKPQKRSERKMSHIDPRTKEEILASEQEALGKLDEIWQVHCEVGDKSTKPELLEASDETCEILNEFDPERFPFDDDEETDEETDLEDEEAA
jgi:hypothetical protein